MPALYSRLFLIASLALAACGDDGDGRAEQDASTRADAAPTFDATSSAADAAALLAEESEPNNGNSATDVNELTLPVAVHGAIGEADDRDIFAVDLVAGELREWRLQAEGAEHAPHLAIGEATSEAPATLGFAQAGGTLSFHHFALKSGRHHFIVRDARNVPSASSQKVGGPANQYVLRSAAPTLSATAITLPMRVNATIANPFELAYFSFNLAQETDVRIEVFARRATIASDIDSRLSLYYVTGDDWLITNDDVGSVRDSLITGALPAGEYRVIVDNLNPDAVKLAFDVDFAVQ